MADDSTLVTRLPHVWIGFCIAGVALLYDLSGQAHSLDAPSIHLAIYFVGFLYWMVCVYKYHDIMGRIQGYNHPITAGRAVGMHWIPLYSLYWVFKWPKEIATFVNWRLQSPNAMNGIIPGILVLAGTIVAQFQVAIGLTIFFSSGLYLSHRIKGACLAPPVPKAMHASASAGPLGIR